jgi:hypothetical protein
MKAMTVREYAESEGISIGAAYRRLWEGRVNARQLYGRWLITPESNQSEPEAQENAPLCGEK